MNLSSFGLIASVWLVVGVLISARRYPGYNHKRQFLSELGASQSPTQKFSPAINNFPLALLFIAFGSHLIINKSLLAVGVCLVLHGLGTFIAGIFPMDADPFTKTPSSAGKTHSIAGAVMFLSLFVASILTSVHPNLGLSFQLLSVVVTLFVLYFTIRLSQEFSRKGDVGLYQRLSYGAQLFWLSCLSLFLMGVVKN